MASRPLPPSVSAQERAAWDAAQARDTGLAPGARKREGVVHTPPELARELARWVDRHLREARGLSGGLADPRVWLLDPACGTGAFLAAAQTVTAGRPGRPGAVWLADIDAQALASARQVARRGECSWPTRFVQGDALQVSPESLAGPLRAGSGPESPAGVGAGLAPDAVPVVLGNPPWSVAADGAPKCPEVASLLKDFQRLPDGQPLKERKLGVLRDRYVLFLRWAFEVVRAAPSGGVVALITNGSFLDGPVHRGMRAAMAQWSEDLTVLDLGGNAMLARAGRRDENPFGVRPSVAITLADCPPVGKRAAGRVAYQRLWGTAAAKQAQLAEIAGGRACARVHPTGPLFLFAPTAPVPATYRDFIALPEAMPFHREGIQTNRDRAAVATSPAALLERLRAFVAGQSRPELAQAERSLSHYDPERARKAVGAALATDPDGKGGRSLRPVAYRPGQVRYLCPVAPFCHRPRPQLLQAMDHASLALLTVRKDRGDAPWNHVAGVTEVADSSFLSARSSCRTRVFPARSPDGAPNLDPSFAQRLGERLGRPVAVEMFIAYALAVLSAPRYRAAFDAALHRDYPRLPLPESGEQFVALTRLGCGLIAPAGRPVSDAIGARLDALLAPAWLS